MSGHAPSKLHIEGVAELWFVPHNALSRSDELIYRPATLVECSVCFRSLRAGLNHSEERTYTAWLPESSLAIDWDQSAVSVDEGLLVSMPPPSDMRYQQGKYVTTHSDLSQYQAELIDQLARTERLRVYFNPVFGLFSMPEERLEDFLSSVAEAALSRVEPELKQLRNKFELRFEQIRQANAQQALQPEDLSFESFMSQKLYLFESENRLATMFSTLAGAVFGAAEPKRLPESSPWDAAELVEDLNRLEQEASEGLRHLYQEYNSLANEYDIFEIGLQPGNIKVTRCALLWVPVASSQ